MRPVRLVPVLAVTIAALVGLAATGWFVIARDVTDKRHVLEYLGLRNPPTRRLQAQRAQRYTPPAPRSPLLQLLANPSAFHRKTVHTIGYLNMEFEGTAIYLNEEAFLHGQMESAVSVVVDEAEARQKLDGADRGWVELVGTFHDLGQNSVFVGSLTVREIGAWPPPWLFRDGDPRAAGRRPTTP